MTGASKSFAGIRALSDFSVTVSEGEILGIIGPNGSGKSTALNIVSGVVKPDAGTIFFRGVDLLGLKQFEVVRQGISRTFQTSVLCAQLNVYENVAAGRFGADDRNDGNLPEILGNGRDDRSIVTNALRFVGLNEVQKMYPVALSHFERRKIEFARALVSRPKLVLLDEPTAGFSQAERSWFERLLLKVCAEGIAVIIIEHDLAFIYRVADRVLVLDAGGIIAEGTPEAIARNRNVAEIYTGIKIKDATNQGSNSQI